MYKKKMQTRKKEKREKLERPYQVRYCVHLNYASLRTRYKRLEGHQPLALVPKKSATRIQLKLLRALSNADV